MQSDADSDISDIPAINIDSSEQSTQSAPSSGIVPSEPDSSQPSESAGNSNPSDISGNNDEDSSSVSSTVSNEPKPIIVKGNTKGVSDEKLIKLEEIINAQTNSISFYYENLETGTVIASTPDKIYFSASVIKAPYVVSILKKGVDLTDTVCIKDVVSDFSEGAELTVDKLIYYTLVCSDNNSYMELVRKYGKPVFNEYSKELGVKARLGSGHYCDMTAYEAAVYFKDIYKYAAESEDGKYIAEYLKNPSYNQQIGRALGRKYTVLQKYGASYNRSVFHNTAIVYAPSPYVLSIFTDFYPSETCTQVFRDIAKVIDEINVSVAEHKAVEVNEEASASG